MRVEIKKLHQRFGTTIVYVTHDQIEAMTLADRIAILKGGHLQQFDSPNACYARPVNRFVAGFIGAPPMSFASVSVANDADRIDLGAARACRCRRRRAGGLPPARAAASSWAFAPSTSACRGAEPAAQGTVELIEPLGSETLALVRLGDALLTGRFPPEAPVKPGSPVPLGLALDHAHLFDADSGPPPSRPPEGVASQDALHRDACIPLASIPLGGLR